VAQGDVFADGQGMEHFHALEGATETRRARADGPKRDTS